MLVWAVLAQFLQGLGKMVLPMVVVLIGNVINVLLNWVFIHGGIFGIELGVLGCGLSTVIGRTITPILLLVLAWPILKAYRPPARAVLLQWAPLKSCCAWECRSGCSMGWRSGHSTPLG